MHFPAIQTPTDLAYKPAASRDPEEIEWLTGLPGGIVIARNQKIGTTAAEIAFDRGTEELGIVQARDLVGVLAVVAFGTAYHLYAENRGLTSMYRRVRLVEITDPTTGERLTEQELADMTSSGLEAAEGLASGIEQRVLAHKPHDHTDIILGKTLAHTGARLAVVDKGINRWPDEPRSQQDAVYGFTFLAHQQMLELSGKLGARPTMAQLPDEQSPLRRYLNDDSLAINQANYTILKESIEEARAISLD